MDVKHNKNFRSVELVRGMEEFLDIEKIRQAGKSLHFDYERNQREILAIDLDDGCAIDKVFLVDKGHKDGKELHAVSKNGIIYILNQQKYYSKKKALVTILIARPNQMVRLYDACGLPINYNILKKCKEHQALGYNKTYAVKKTEDSKEDIVL